MKFEPPKHWASAILGAVLLALVSAACVTVVCGLYGVSLPAAALAGGIVGCGLSLAMLRLFYWRQVTAREMWQTISALWHEFGKY
jgi:small neutral amino acid transporter SnatA (MarC family)